MKTAPSLASVLRQITMALILSIAALAAALFYFSGALRYASSNMLQSVDSVYFAEELRENFRRLEEDPSSKEDRRITERILSDLRANLTSRVEKEMIDELVGHVAAFHAGSFEALRRARRTAVNLIALNREQAQKFHEEVERYDRRSNMVAIGAILLAGALFLLIHRRLQALVIAPLAELAESLRLYTAGLEVTPVRTRHVAELGEVRELFAELRQTVERQRRLQLEFVASVAHDIRNPIANIATAIRQLKPGSTLGPKHSAQIFQIAERQTEHLSHLVDDLLDRSRIESGRFTLDVERHDLVAIVEDAISWHEQSSKEHDIVVSIGERPIWIECDRNRLMQVLNNLVSNAIKYSPSGGRIGVSVSVSNAMALVSVEDEGIGIPPEDVDKIFTAFSRSARSRDSIPGVGLGLSVVKKIVEAHAGKVSVSARSTGGSRFVVEIPLRSASPVEERPLH